MAATLATALTLALSQRELTGVGIRIPSFRRRPEPRGGAGATSDQVRGRLLRTHTRRNQRYDLLFPQPGKIPCVSILASKRNGTLYTGVTSDLAQRVWQLKNGLAEGFTRQYGVHRLVWYETHPAVESAIGPEKQRK